MNKNFFAIITLLATASFGYFFYAGLEKETVAVASQVVITTATSSTRVEFALADLDGN